MPKHKSTRSRPKTLYRVKNWSEYDKALVQRGPITIWFMLTMKNVFHLPNRATEGFVCSVFAMLGVKLSVPDHTTLSRRGKDLNVILPKKVSGHIDIVMDSTGLKVYGEGGWKVRTHGKSKRRTWRKLHSGADLESPV
jgi:hypothetical protein